MSKAAKQTVEMVARPLPIKLDKADQTALKKLNDDQQAVNNFIATVQRQGEQRLAQLQAEGRETWQKIAAKYELDMDHISYNLNNAGDTLVPVQQVLVDPDDG